MLQEKMTTGVLWSKLNVPGMRERPFVCTHPTDYCCSLVPTSSNTSVNSMRSCAWWFYIENLGMCWQETRSTVMVRHNGRVIRGIILAATRKGVPYDIAVIVCEPSTNSIAPCLISDRVATVGELINIICMNSFL